MNIILLFHGSPVFLWDSFTSNLGDVGQKLIQKCMREENIWYIYIYVFYKIVPNVSEK